MAYMKGEAIPSDAELLRGLSGEEVSHTARVRRWVYSHVPAPILWDGFSKWCELIEGAIDPDLKVDEGL